MRGWHRQKATVNLLDSDGEEDDYSSIESSLEEEDQETNKENFCSAVNHLQEVDLADGDPPAQKR